MTWSSCSDFVANSVLAFFMVRPSVMGALLPKLLIMEGKLDAWQSPSADACLSVFLYRHGVICAEATAGGALTSQDLVGKQKGIMFSLNRDVPGRHLWWGDGAMAMAGSTS